MRPVSLDEFVGQEHILAPDKPLRLQIERDDPGSILFWGLAQLRISSLSLSSAASCSA